MNAYILEIRGNRAAALTEDGRFVRIRNQGYEVGQSVELSGHGAGAKTRARFAALASMAAGFLLLAFGGWQGYVAPAGLVSLDVNPSIEYTVNCFDRVLAVEGVNGDGDEIIRALQTEELRFRSIDEAVEATIAQLRISGYLTDETGNEIVLSANAGTTAHADALAARLGTLAARQADLFVTSVAATDADVRRAHEMGASAGKLYLIEQLEKAVGPDDSFDPKAWVDTSVREIIRQTNLRLETARPGGAAGGSVPEITPRPSATAPQPGGRASASAEPDANNTPSGGAQDGSSGSGGEEGSDPPSGGGNPAR